MANAGTLPTRLASSGLATTYIAATRIPYGAAVVRAAAGTCKAAITPDVAILGIAMDDDREHLYDGFYEIYEPVPVVNSGDVRTLCCFISNADMVAGDYLEVGDFSSHGTTQNWGVLAEAGSAAGETPVVTAVAQALEDGDFGSAYYQVPASDVAVGDTTITMAAGAIASMGLVVGEYILMADINGAVHVNRITGLTSTVISLEIPSVGALVNGDNDLVYRLWQKKVKLIG
jgi:hypothetical protein